MIDKIINATIKFTLVLTLEVKMSEFHSREILKAGALGTYRMHSLFTRITSSGDLDVAECDRFKFAVALHAHEYTHYLHNLTTRAGLDALTPCFWLIPYFVRNTDEFGRFTAPNDNDEDGYVSLAFNIMRSCRGAVDMVPKGDKIKRQRIVEWVINDPQFEMIELNHDGKRVGSFDKCTVKIIAKSHNSQSTEINLTPGLDFISEGVAYEVEREQCRLAGIEEKDLDSQTPSYPYLAYRPLVDHFVGRETTSIERIAIGNYALMSNSPSTYFFELCFTLTKGGLAGDENSKEFFELTKEIKANFKKIKSDSITSQIKNNVKGSGWLFKGANLYSSLIERGMALRSQWPLMELAFIQKKLTPNEFRLITSNLLDHVVCQEKVEPPHKIEWVGSKRNDLISASDSDLQYLGVLQSSIHYLQQHFTNEGRLGDTAEMPDSACPFDGVCPLQNSYSNPNLCATKPWQVSIGDGQTKICWYEAGRLSLSSKWNTFY